MSDMGNEEHPRPIRLTEGVKCPYCGGGYFRWHHLVSLDTHGRERQHSYIRCDHLHPPCKPNEFDPNYSEYIRVGAYWAVVGKEVKLIRPEKETDETS